ncbi:hypothetical protein ABEB36_015330 [Hypothenemus hampei]|uniref:MADF domain-containing protein n=1 Tax=Hypothenemus hampei TaxID=57062 RepID=A0ABD1DZW1_HYPHA
MIWKNLRTELVIMPIQQRSQIKREKLWQEIFEKFRQNSEFPIEFLQKKWKNLKDTYIRLRSEYIPSRASDMGLLRAMQLLK